MSDYFEHRTIVDALDPENLSRRMLLPLLLAYAAEKDGTPCDGAVVVRGHQPLIIRMAYEAFLQIDHAALGELLLDHHLPDGTVLCAYRGVARPRGAIALPAGTARAIGGA
jgi:hypothetical protein